MEKKLANRENWSRILEKEYKQLSIDEGESFRGNISYLYLHKVREPLIVRYDVEDICIVNDGFVWMMHFPEGKGYSVTTTFDQNGNVVQWYFDIIHSQGLTANGIPYIEDLYLDLVVLPNGHTYVLDEDELEEALNQKIISKSQFKQAYRTLHQLIDSVNSKSNYFINESHRLFQLQKELAT